MQKLHQSATLWATEFTVSVTENSVAQTVYGVSAALQPLGEGHFGVCSIENSGDLTKDGLSGVESAIYCQNTSRHVAVIFHRGARRWF